jgi:hypothetical protein
MQEKKGAGVDDREKATTEITASRWRVMQVNIIH